MKMNFQIWKLIANVQMKTTRSNRNQSPKKPPTQALTTLNRKVWTHYLAGYPSCCITGKASSLALTKFGLGFNRLGFYFTAWTSIQVFTYVLLQIIYIACNVQLVQHKSERK